MGFGVILALIGLILLTGEDTTKSQNYLIFGAVFAIMSLVFLVLYRHNYHLYCYERNKHFARRDKLKPMDKDVITKRKYLVKYSKRKNHNLECIHDVIEFMKNYDGPNGIKDLMKQYRIIDYDLKQMYQIFDKVPSSVQLYNKTYCEYLPYSCFFYKKSFIVLFLYYKQVIKIDLKKLFSVFEAYFEHDNVDIINQLMAGMYHQNQEPTEEDTKQEHEHTHEHHRHKHVHVHKTLNNKRTTIHHKKIN